MRREKTRRNTGTWLAARLAASHTVPAPRPLTSELQRARGFSAAIDNGSASPLNDSYRPSRSELESTRSGMVVSQLGWKSCNHYLLLVSAAMVCLLAGPRPALGAGCHVPDRPALTHALSWDHFAGAAVSRNGHSATHVRSAIMPAHCPGETPTLPSSTTQLFAPLPRSRSAGEVCWRRVGRGPLHEPSAACRHLSP